MGHELIGIVKAVLVTPGKESFLSQRVEAVKASLEGFEGEQRHYGATKPADGRQPYYPRGTTIRNFRQLSILSVEELAQTAALAGLSELLPEWYGANLLLEGIPNLTLLPPSTRLFFSRDCTLTVDGENLPCDNVAGVVQAQFPLKANLKAPFLKAALHRRGVVAWVERPGEIAVGDQVRALLPGQMPYPL
jgi:hypothetical protein